MCSGVQSSNESSNSLGASTRDYRVASKRTHEVECFPEFDEFFCAAARTTEPFGNELTSPDPHPVLVKDNSPEGVSESGADRTNCGVGNTPKDSKRDDDFGSQSESVSAQVGPRGLALISDRRVKKS